MVTTAVDIVLALHGRSDVGQHLLNGVDTSEPNARPAALDVRDCGTCDHFEQPSRGCPVRKRTIHRGQSCYEAAFGRYDWPKLRQVQQLFPINANGPATLAQELGVRLLDF